MVDALILVWAGYHGSQRTGRFSTGIVTSAVTGLLGFTIFFVYAAVTAPSLLLAPFENPFIFVIMAILLGMALAFSMAAGSAGAAVSRWLPPSRWRTRAS